MFKVGDLVRRKEMHRDWSACWGHGDTPCTVLAVKDDLVLTSAEDAWKIASRFESAIEQPLWRDRLFADLRAAGASHAAATEFVTAAPAAARIRDVYDKHPERVVIELIQWYQITKAFAYWLRIHVAHVARCRVPL